MASYYKGPDLTREQLAQVAYQGGFRGELLGQMVAMSHDREAWNFHTQAGASAGAHRTSTNDDSRASGDFGLWQINWGTWGDRLVEAGIVRTHTDLYDPVTNARAAKYVYDRQGLGAWAMGSNGFQAGGDPFRGVNVAAGQQAVQRASSQGMLGQDWNQASAQAGGGGAAGAGAATPLTNLPRDARFVEVPGVAQYAMFQMQPGLWIRYAITPDSGINTAGRYFTKLTRQEWARTFGDSVQGGDAAELAEIPTAFGTYQAFTNAILDQVFAKGDPRRNDPEIMRVLATRAGRPDMTEAEFENLLKGTNYYQQRTEGELRWNDLSEAQRQTERRDMAARMRQAHVQYTGRAPSMQHFLSGDGRANVEDLASGKMGFGQWTETVLKPAASQNPESPWSRQMREEQEAQRQRPIDIENTMARIKDTLVQWGLPQWSNAFLRRWAQGIVENKRSDDDLLEEVKKQAQVLYPWKDPEMETVVAAAPWIETYNRVLNRQGSLETPEIAKTLSAYGRAPDENDPWSFEQRLKMTDDYDQTRQGQDEAHSTVAELAGMMGF